MQKSNHYKKEKLQNCKIMPFFMLNFTFFTTFATN